MVHRSTFATLALLCATAIAAPAGAAAVKAAKPNSCVSSTEKLALDTRVLQTELLIGALSCGQGEQYNQFVTSFQPQLQEQGGHLISLFQRIHGAKGADKLNEFVTNLANDASKRSQNIGYGYCYFTWDIFYEAFDTAPESFAKLVDKPWIPVRHGFNPCESS
jgi:hypothetical protein